MAWELIFMLLLLKIPLFYLCGVVWWAVKAEPVIEDGPGDVTPVREPVAPVSPPNLWSGGRRRLERRLPPSGPARGPARSRVAQRTHTHGARG